MSANENVLVSGGRELELEKFDEPIFGRHMPSAYDPAFCRGRALLTLQKCTASGTCFPYSLIPAAGAQKTTHTTALKH